MQEAYIVAGYRTAVGKAKRGGFRFFRPDDLAIEVIQGLLRSVPELDTEQCAAVKHRHGSLHDARAPFLQPVTAT